MDKYQSEELSFSATKSGDTLSDTLKLSEGIHYIKVIPDSWWGYQDAENLPYFISMERGTGENNEASAVSENRGEYMISFNNETTFWGNAKKFTNEKAINAVFGDITINWNGTAYKATSIKVVTKKGNNYIQILKTESADKNFNKGIKKLTKGTSGLKFTIKSLKVTDSNAKAVVKTVVKDGKLKKVIITTNAPKPYVAKYKKDYTYSDGVITFTGKNIEGSCAI